MLFAATDRHGVSRARTFDGDGALHEAEDYPYGFPPEEVDGQALLRWLRSGGPKGSQARATPRGLTIPASSNGSQGTSARPRSPGRDRGALRQDVPARSAARVPLVSSADAHPGNRRVGSSPADHSRYLAHHIAGARLVVFPTNDIRPVPTSTRRGRRPCRGVPHRRPSRGGAAAQARHGAVHRHRRLDGSRGRDGGPALAPIAR